MILHKRVSLHYEADTPKQFDSNIKKAESDYDQLITEGYPKVRIIVSNHWASEGIWVEAGEKFSPLSGQDTVYKTFNNEAT